MNLSQPDPLWIMQILATLFTLGTSILSMMAQPTRNSSGWVMMMISPAMIFVFSVTFAKCAGHLLGCYQRLFNGSAIVDSENPFKIRREA